MTRYGYRFLGKHVRGESILEPIVEVAFQNPGGWRMAESTLDFGADISLIPKDFADQLSQYPPFTAEEITNASGSTAIGEGMNVLIQLEGVQLLIPVIVVPDIPRPLLGRLGVMDRFSIQFDPNGFSVSPVIGDGS